MLKSNSEDQGKQESTITNPTDTNAEYIHIVQNQEVWFVDYIIGIAFKTPINFTSAINKYGIGLLESERPYREFYDSKDFQDYMDEKTGQEVDIESSIDPRSNLELNDKKIIWHIIK